jgi:hypothetical protein
VRTNRAEIAAYSTSTLWCRSPGQIYNIVISRVKCLGKRRNHLEKLRLVPIALCKRSTALGGTHNYVPQRSISNEDRMMEQRLHCARRHSLTLSSVSPKAHALNVPWNRSCSISEALPVTRRTESLNHTQSFLSIKGGTGMVSRTSTAGTGGSKPPRSRFGRYGRGVESPSFCGASHPEIGVRLFEKAISLDPPSKGQGGTRLLFSYDSSLLSSSFNLLFRSLRVGSRTAGTLILILRVMEVESVNEKGKEA